MYAFVNILLIGAFFVCFLVAYFKNLYECAVLLGQMLFAFFCALSFSAPLGELLKESFNLEASYREGIGFFAIWLVIVLGFPAATRAILRQRGEKLRFAEGALDLPGRIGAGVFAGFMVAGALAVGLLTFPPVAGSFFAAAEKPGNNRQLPVFMHVDRKALAAYVAVTAAFSSEAENVDGLVTRTQERAVLDWAEARLAQYRQSVPPQMKEGRELCDSLRQYASDSRRASELCRRAGF